MIRRPSSRTARVLLALSALAGGLVLVARQGPPPTPVPTLAAGASHSAAIDASGAVWAWGANVGGQVGDGTTATRTAPVRITALTGTFTAVAAGGAHTLALRNDGRVFGWGLNANGEIGDGSTAQRLSPVLLPSLTGIVTVAAGATHSLALRSNGTVAAWGANSEGQLGDNSTTARATPITVSGLTNVVAIAAGGQHSLALKADGTVWAWGANGSGQIGDNTTTRRRVPVRVTTLAAAKAIAAGGLHSAAVTQAGTVFAWGGNGSGAVGDGTTTTRRVPVLVAGLAGMATVSAGAAHTAAVSTSGAHWAWGANPGALGDGTTAPRLSPVSIATPVGATLVAAGGAHSLALTTNGTVWSTGVNLLGPLGSGNTASTTVYGPISGPAQVWGVNAPVLSPTGGTFTLPQSVTATTVTPGASIHYTINGADPTTTDPSVTSGGLIPVDRITVLKAKAFRTGMTASPVTSGTYTLQVATPTLAPGAGTYAAPQTVSLATASPGATLYYTLDGTDPTPASTLYSAPFVIGGSATLKVLGVRAGLLDSAIASAVYTFNFGTLSTPVATPAGGTYQTPQTVTLSADPGAAIHYTLDGTDPTPASPSYTAPFALGATATLKARAFRTDYTPSAILTESYVIDTTGGGDPIPPDPSTVAPPLSQTEVTPFDQQVSFLYTGANPIQRNVDVSALEPHRIAVLRGMVMARDGQPLPGARVKVLNRPEFGYTVSRLDGMFDLVVNGGAPLTVEYTRAGYLSAQRTVDPRWRDYEWASPVRLIQRDANVTTVDFSVTAPAQVARATVQTDAAGSRQATFIIPAGGVMARMTLSDGTVLPNLAQLSLRATEYTVGPGGPEAMPGELPLFSGYTYAVELSADEADAAQATSLTFDPPLPFYVDNFLNMPVGTPAPAGYYDDVLGAWTPTANGRVLRILSPDAAGRAGVDVDGSGQAANSAALAALGITDGERQRLAEIYAPGTSVWRTPVPHFSPLDINWPVRLESPKKPSAPPGNDPNDNLSRQDDDQPTCVSGSVIECENQVLGESVPVAGTPYSLTYRSSRSEGRVAKRALKYRLSNATSAAEALQISSTIRVAGREFKSTHAPAPNQTRTFTWNGLDAYGRRVVGAVGVRIEVTNEFEAQYAVATADPAFGGPGGPPTGIIMRIPFSVSTQTDEVLMGTMAPLGAIGGWSLSAHHAFDPRSATLYRGDGGQRQALARGLVIDVYAGGAQGAIAADGNVLVVDGGGLRRFRRDGTVDQVSTEAPAGGNQFESQVGPNEDLYYVAGDSVGEFAYDKLIVGRYRRSGAHNVIVSIPVSGSCSFVVQTGAHLAVAPDGTIYASMGQCLYQINADGSHLLLLSSGTDEFSALAVDATNTLFYAEWEDTAVNEPASRIYRLLPSGEPALVAGNGQNGLAQDGELALTSPISVSGMTIDRSGAVVFKDSYAGASGGVDLVRRIDAEGRLTTLAGGVGLPVRDGWPATASGVSNGPLLLGPDGGLYLPRDGRRIAPFEPAGNGTVFQVASDDASEVYDFTVQGRHLRTRDALTGVELSTFEYDSGGYLLRVRDREGLVTTVSRSGATISAITGPFGTSTGVTMHGSAANLLGSVTDAEGQSYTFDYGNDLLTRLVDPNGRIYDFAHDAFGYLERDEDPESGVQTLSRVTSGSTWQVTRGRLGVGDTTYLSERSSNNATRRTTTGPDGTQTIDVIVPDDLVTRTAADGTVQTTTLAPDLRFGTMAPVAEQTTVRLPSGLTRTASQSRTVSLLDPTDLLSVESSTETTSVNGRTYSSTYDRAGNQITSVSPEGRQTVTTLDALGRPSTVQVGDLLPTTFRYDTQGRLEAREQGPRTTSFTYDARGFLDGVTDPLSRTVSFTNDAVGRALQQRFPDMRTATFRYDGNSNLKGLTPPGRPEHQFDYTGVNLLETYTPPTVPSAGPTGYTYDTARRPRVVTRADGQTLTFDYEVTGGRLLSLTTPTGVTTYGYEPGTGRLATVTAPGASLAYGYDGSLLLNETWSGSVQGAVAWTYDNDFRITNETVRGGHTVSVGYDNDGLLMSVGATTITRFPATGLLQTSTVGGVATTFGYNGFGELTSHATTVGGSPAYGATLGRDAGGRIQQQAEVLGGVTTTDVYGYDTAGRLETVTRNGTLAVTYGYDANGNRNGVTTAGGTVSATFDDQDRILTFGTRTYTHTPHGDVAGWTDSATSTTTTLTYDVQGNLRTVQQPGTTITYTVDGRNRRIGKAVNGTPVQGFLWQGQLRPVAELDGSGALVSRFVYGTRINVPEYLVKGGTTYRIVTDHLGSVRLVVDTTTNTVVQALTYDPWGVVLADTNPGFQPFGYAGGLYDWQTGLVRFGVRDYDATIGRWLTKDPIGFGGGDPGLYGYAGGAPLDRIDPSGQDAISIAYRSYPITTPIGNLPLGHGAVIAVDDVTGKTRYFEYGRYEPAGEFGMVRTFPVPDVVMGRDGRPTAESLAKLYAYISKRYGKNSPVDATYYDGADYAKVVAFAEGRMRDPNRRPYNLLLNSCFTFASEAIRAGHQ